MQSTTVILSDRVKQSIRVRESSLTDKHRTPLCRRGIVHQAALYKKNSVKNRKNCSLTDHFGSRWVIIFLRWVLFFLLNVITFFFYCDHLNKSCNLRKVMLYVIALNRYTFQPKRSERSSFRLGTKFSGIEPPSDEAIRAYWDVLILIYCRV